MLKLKFLLQIILNTLFPSKCVGCKIKNILLCDECLSKIPPSLQSFDTTTSVFNYKNTVIKKALWILKYKGNKKMGEIFARIVYDKILEEISDEKILSNFREPLLIPIPLSKKRLRERGFNQSEVIAHEISILDTGMSFTFANKILYKIKDTPSQVSIKDKAKRLKNLHGCFSIKDKKSVCGKNIILIDDITTTGATIAEVNKTLLYAGAKKVIAFTVAH